MSIVIDLQLAVATDNTIPTEQQLARWVRAALPAEMRRAEVAIRLVDRAESAFLNETYRHKQGPTNILSFPFEDDADLSIPLLGDLVVCAPLVQQEAEEQQKSVEFHWAHLIVHGTLHLLGYDHIEEQQAIAMETLETQILYTLGYPNPYGDR